jgi:hypothetical protein
MLKTMKCFFFIAGAILLMTLLAPACRRIRQQYTWQSENPPCHRCASTYASTRAVRDVDLTELIRNQTSYRDQIMRVHANMDNDAGYKWLHPAETTAQSQPFPAEFTDPASIVGCDGVEQILREVAGINDWFDGSASVVLVGRVANLNQIHQGQRGFEIICVERASTVGAKLP